METLQNPMPGFMRAAISVDEQLVGQDQDREDSYNGERDHLESLLQNGVSKAKQAANIVKHGQDPPNEVLSPKYPGKRMVKILNGKKQHKNSMYEINNYDHKVQYTVNERGHKFYKLVNRSQSPSKLISESKVRN